MPNLRFRDRWAALSEWTPFDAPPLREEDLPPPPPKKPRAVTKDTRKNRKPKRERDAR
jgi:hypothetical protein